MPPGISLDIYSIWLLYLIPRVIGGLLQLTGTAVLLVSMKWINILLVLLALTHVNIYSRIWCHLLTSNARYNPRQPHINISP